jgi:hypothetical protein
MEEIQMQTPKLVGTRKELNCRNIVEDGNEMVNKLGNRVDSQTVKDNLRPVKKEVMFFNSHETTRHEKRKLLQRLQLGKRNYSCLDTTPK